MQKKYKSIINSNIIFFNLFFAGGKEIRFANVDFDWRENDNKIK